MMKYILYSAAFLLLVHFAVGETGPEDFPHGGVFQCVQCDNYHDGVECGHGSDVNKTKFMKPCNNDNIYNPEKKEFVMCRKIVTKVDFDVNSNKATERIKRTCGYEKSDYDTKCYYRAGLGGRVTVCSCTDAGCNDGSLLTPTATTGLCLSILAAFLVKSINFS